MAGNRPPSRSLSPSQLPPLPGSPTYSYASTANPSLSQYKLPLPPPPRPAHEVLTKADLEQSQTAYGDVLASAKAYRVALAALSTAASAFGSALESCARLKEARADALLSSGATTGGSGISGSVLLGSSSFNAKGTCTADTLLTVAGLQHLVANHQQILSETVYRSFEVPLLHELDKWRAAVDDEEEGYANAMAAQSREIRRLEKEGLRLQRQRRRDVAKFRSHLVELTEKLDGLTVLHAEHARTLLRESQETSARIVDASCSLVRAEVDIFESLARKGWTGGGLEDVLEKGVDLFASDEPTGAGRGGNSYSYAAGGGASHLGSRAGVGGSSVGGGGGGADGDGTPTKLFSILPPKSILADSASDTGMRAGSCTRADSLHVDTSTDRYQSLAGAISATDNTSRGGDRERERDRDTESVFSEFNRSRGIIRPFSPQPQPLGLNPEELLGGLEEAPSSDAKSKPSSEGRRRQEDDGDDGDGVEHGNIGDDDDEESQPWRDEGLRRSPDTEEEEQGPEQQDLDNNIGAISIEEVFPQTNPRWSICGGS